VRIAWVTPYVPAPENNGGRIRIARLASGFPDDDMHLYARLSVHDSPGAYTSLPPWREVHTLAPPKNSSLPSLLPGAARDFPRGLWTRLAADHERKRFDAVIVEHCHAGNGFRRLPGAAMVLDEHNIESRYFLRELEAGRARMQNLAKWLKWRAWERRMWGAVDQVTVVSREDLLELQRVRPEHGIVVQNGVNFDNYRFILPSARTKNGILFVGMMSYPPNVVAATTLAREILPALRKRVPDATLTIAGRDPSGEVKALANDFVRVTGTLPSVTGLFDEHGAYAMPLDLGAGSSLKVLEPLAAGLPLVASPFAVRGFALEPERHFLRADNPKEFVQALERALGRRAELDPMALEARKIASQNSWHEIARSFAAEVRRTVAREKA
jgi:glycosyltransferase involved in cell wall biosynthesis